MGFLVYCHGLEIHVFVIQNHTNLWLFRCYGIINAVQHLYITQKVVFNCALLPWKNDSFLVLFYLMLNRSSMALFAFFVREEKKRITFKFRLWWLFSNFGRLLWWFCSFSPFLFKDFDIMSKKLEIICLLSFNLFRRLLCFWNFNNFSHIHLIFWLNLNLRLLFKKSDWIYTLRFFFTFRNLVLNYLFKNCSRVYYLIIWFLMLNWRIDLTFYMIGNNLCSLLLPIKFDFL